MTDQDQAKYAAYLAECKALAVEYADRVECRYCSTMMLPSDEDKYWECPECGCRIHMFHAKIIALPAGWRDEYRSMIQTVSPD